MKQRRFAFVSPVFVALVLATFGLFANVGAAQLDGADQGSRVLTTTLTGAEESPGPGDPDGSGFAVLRLNADQNTICYTLMVKDIEFPTTGAHIHEAPAGDSGGVVQGLNPPTQEGASSVGTSSGCVQPADTNLIEDILQNPEEYYVNVHNGPFGGGAVRGQLGD
jgi:hypothetical protein